MRRRRSPLWPRGSSYQPGAAWKQATPQPSPWTASSSGTRVAPHHSWEQWARGVQAGPGIACDFMVVLGQGAGQMG